MDTKQLNEALRTIYDEEHQRIVFWNDPQQEFDRVVETLDLDNEPTGLSYIAVDAVDAGFGDRVLLTLDGWAAMTAVGRPRSPIDTAIIGVIDHVELDS